MREGDAGRDPLPVTVGHRIGIDKVESYDFVRDFVGTVAAAGCEVFIVHARNAWLQASAPRGEPRDPAAALRAGGAVEAHFPQLTPSPSTAAQDARPRAQLAVVDGVMIAANEIGAWRSGTRDSLGSLTGHAGRSWLAPGPPACGARPGQPAMRHALGLWNGTPGSRRWRQVWSDHV